MICRPLCSEAPCRLPAHNPGSGCTILAGPALHAYMSFTRRGDFDFQCPAHVTSAPLFPTALHSCPCCCIGYMLTTEVNVTGGLTRASLIVCCPCRQKEQEGSETLVLTLNTIPLSWHSSLITELPECSGSVDPHLGLLQSYYDPDTFSDSEPVTTLSLTGTCCTLGLVAPNALRLSYPTIILSSTLCSNRR